MLYPKCGGRMKVVALLRKYFVAHRIIRDLKLTPAAKKPPFSQVLGQFAPVTAKESGMHEWRVISKAEAV